MIHLEEPGISQQGSNVWGQSGSSAAIFGGIFHGGQASVDLVRVAGVVLEHADLIGVPVTGQGGYLLLGQGDRGAA
ncbi:hypothetical protein JL100_022590 [Skermanella mucosa]|uniref:hypothetical protein n=1 Tax=Skermanella mucosa TaxID=1789672 RepID=UPI00192CDE07|nr:hypothetical protein [Skermanella mucosa]UEM19845.1 hypothetical protein JL100_022590 [Skermanella mucosa]